MNEQEFKRRTKDLALRVIRLVRVLPKETAADVIAKQLLRCATSVGANYRAACRGRSIADVINKLSIVEEEADECFYWLELLAEAEIVSRARLDSLLTETNEMVVASIKTLRAKNAAIQNPKSKIYNPDIERLIL